VTVERVPALAYIESVMAEPPMTDRFSEQQATYAVRGRDTPDLDQGIAAIRNVLRTLPARPGIYRMQDAAGDVLYVGKAKSLKNRVTSYTQVARLPTRLKRMVALTRAMTVVTTASEAEALLLEAQLIKRFRPAFNVLLRDDKSFPFIFLNEDHAYPRMSKHRGARRGKGIYYGPFASAGAVNTTLNALQKVFLLRSCSDSFMANRSRPCLLYQIRRCSAPCVGRIDAAGYAELVTDAKEFLAGRSQAVQKKLGDAMMAAAERQDFELAAVLRDRLRALTYIQSAQGTAEGVRNADAVALAEKGGEFSLQAFFVRGGQNWGHRAIFPKNTAGSNADDVMAGVLMQLYEEMVPPPEILLDRVLPEADLIAEALSVKAGRKVVIRQPRRGPLKRLVEQAARNAVEALDRSLAESTTQSKLLAGVADLFDLDAPPRRIEVYDNSHIMGTNAGGAMIVAGPEGFIKNAYRKFNIKDASIAPGDDFGMMRHVLGRRLARLTKEAEGGEHPADWPDLVLIDGGRGQLNAAAEMLAEAGIDDIVVVGVAKGPDRNAGREVFHLADGREITLPPNDPVLFFLQRLRDEAHRFAIGAHRAKRSKAIGVSSLDDIPGIGPARKRALLMHFGSAKAVRAAALESLQAAPGVSKAMAQAIWDHFHAAG
jgi:excinuclease ABC subunit C